MSSSKIEDKEKAVLHPSDGSSIALPRSPARSANAATPKRSPSPSNLSPSPSSVRSRSSSRSLSRPARSIDSPRARRDDASLSPSPSPVGTRTGPRAEGPCVKVTGLTRLVTKAHIKDIFGHYGNIEACEYAMFTKSRECKGHAWVLYFTSSSARTAIEYMDQGQIDGAVVSVEYGRFPPPSDASPRDYRRGERYPLSYGRDAEWDRRSGRPNGSQVAEPDRYESSRSRFDDREFREGPSARYPPTHMTRHASAGYARRSLSPPPRRLKRQRSLSPSVSPSRDIDKRRDDYQYNGVRRRDGSMSRSRSRSSSSMRSRSRSYSPGPDRRHDSRSRSWRSPSHASPRRQDSSRSRSPSPSLRPPSAPRRGRDQRVLSTSRSASRGPSPA